MSLAELAEALGWGFLGGLSLSGYDVYQDATRPKAKRRSRDWLYWFAFVFRPVLGVMLVLLYERSGTVLNAFSAFGTGLTGPTILQGLLKQTYRSPPPAEDETEA